jgi:hypothetical protein
MTPEIIQAIVEELKEIALEIQTNTGIYPEVFLKNDYNRKEGVTSATTFIVIDFPNAPESKMFSGGLTSVEWDLHLNIYCFLDDNAVSYDLSTSLSYLQDFDFIRDAFNLRALTKSWVTSSMKSIVSNYGSTFAFVGIQDAASLPDGNNIKGFCLIYNTIHLNANTLVYSTLNTGTDVSLVPAIVFR